MQHLPSVLMFGWEFPPYNSGGLGVACEGLTKALSSSGVDLTFVLPFKIPIKVPWCKFVFADESPNFLTENDIKKMYSGYQSHGIDIKKNNFNVVESKDLVSGSLSRRVLAYGLKGGDIANKNKHSIIHAHDWLSYPAGVSAKKVSGMPFVAHIHATEFDRSGDNINKEIFRIEKMGFDNADIIVAVSGKTKDKVIEKYGISEKKVKVIHNGIDFNNNFEDAENSLEKLKKHGAKIVLFVGRITFQKGPDYFVSMAQKVLKFEPNTYFVVSGSGDMEGQMIKMVSDKGLSSRFIFCGFLRGSELARVYKSADVFVMPSVSEPFGLVPLEAMISEVPVLVSKESGVSEVISTALKSNFWDVDDMTDKVVSVLRHKKLKNHLSSFGKQEVKTIHWKKAVNSLIDIYNSLTPNLQTVLN